MTAVVVRCQEVTARLGDHPAVEGLTFRLEAGDFLAVAGPNGAGKTTVLKLLIGLVQPAAGTLEVFGRRPQDVPATWIGYVPQVKTLERRFPALAEELVLTGLRPAWPGRLRAEDRRRARMALALVGAESLAAQPIAQLSGGQLQRVYLARSLARRPRLLLLDEPAAGMDVAGESDLYQILEDFQRAERSTVIMITHDLDVARHHATRALLLDRRPLGFGPPGEVLVEARLRQAYGHLGHPHRMGRPAEARDA